MKKLLYVLITFFLCIFIIELFSFTVLSIKNTHFSRKAILEDQQVIIENSGSFKTQIDREIPNFLKLDILHPYLGFVYNDPTPADQLGFRNTLSPIQKKGENKVILGIVGGSFAWGTFVAGMGTLIDRLKQDEAFKNKEIVPIRLAAGGYKQPQQLMTLNYFLSLGAEFDILINIDGFNEATLPVLENIPKNTNPFFPRLWSIRVAPMSDPDFFNLIVEGKHYRNRRVQIAKIFHSETFSSSFTLNLIWQLIDNLIEKKINEINDRALRTEPTTSSYVSTGPNLNLEGRDLYQELANIWKRSSIQMNALSKANDIQYYHFLQPNQYLPGSKPLTAEERKVAVISESFKRIVQEVYPVLQKSSDDLKKKGIKFKDLTMTYADQNQSLYIDACCHVNSEGYNIFADRIAKFILSTKK